MRSSIFIISLFLVVKIFQLANSFVFASLFSNEQGSVIMVSSIVIIGAVVACGLLSATRFVLIVVILSLIITSQISPSWIIIFLTAMSVLGLIAMEAQVLQSLNNFRNIPKWIPSLLAVLPVVISYQFPQAHLVAPELFYLVSSILALVISYAPRLYGGGRFIVYSDAPPLWLGISFMAGSGLFYYLVAYSENAAMPTEEALPFVMLFYVGGALALYMSLDNRVRREIKA